MSTAISSETSPSEVLGEFRDRMNEIVERVIAQSEQGTLGAGQALQTIVREAKEYIEETEATMSKLDANDGQASVMDLIGQQSDLVQGFIRDLNERVERQDRIATAAERSLKDITEAGATIDRITRESRMLALNALIETHRLGQDGRSLAVIADHMKQLSETVADANEKINELSTHLLRVLPEMADEARSMRATCDGFSGEVAEQIDHVARRTDELREVIDEVRALGRERLDLIVEASHGALRHLAFQDPVAQDLRRMVHMPFGEEDAPPESDTFATDDDDDGAEAGDVLLF